MQDVELKLRFLESTTRFMLIYFEYKLEYNILIAAFIYNCNCADSYGRKTFIFLIKPHIFSEGSLR